MKRLSVYMMTAAAALTVTGAAPAAAYGATTYSLPSGNGQMVVIGGNNLGQLQGILGQLGGNISFSDCNQIIQNLPNCGQTLPYFPGSGNPGMNFPGANFPGTNLPDVNLPDINLPDANLPDINLPDINLPDTSLPAPDLPTPELPDNPDTDRPDTDTSQDEFANRVVKLVNEERAKAGLSALTVNARAAGAAQTRAGEIVVSFSHTRPDGSSFSTALTQAGAAYRSAGENIAYGQRSPEEVMQVWMNSSGHRANILNGEFTSIGVGHLRNAAGVDYWTQMFMN